MTSLDWILLALLLLSTLVGIWRGLVYEVLSLLGWVAAFFAAQWAAPWLAAHLPVDGLSEPVRHASAFVLSFIAAALLAGLIASVMRKGVGWVGLRPVDRVLGAAFGALRGVVLLLALAAAVDLTPWGRAQWWQESAVPPVLALMLAGLKPTLPDAFVRFLN